MRKRNIFRIVIVAVIAAGIFLFARAENPRQIQEPCTESLDECCKEKPKADKMIWESLPQQFFSNI